jgi:hypothetical protein
VSKIKIIFPSCEKCGKELIMGDNLHCPECDEKAEQELLEKIGRVKSCRKCVHVGESTCVGTVHAPDRTLGEVLDERDPNRYDCGLLKKRVRNPLKPACFGESFVLREDCKYLRSEYIRPKREE